MFEERVFERSTILKRREATRERTTSLDRSMMMWCRAQVFRFFRRIRCCNSRWLNLRLISSHIHGHPYNMFVNRHKPKCDHESALVPYFTPIFFTVRQQRLSIFDPPHPPRILQDANAQHVRGSTCHNPHHP